MLNFSQKVCQWLLKDFPSIEKKKKNAYEFGI